MTVSPSYFNRLRVNLAPRGINVVPSPFFHQFKSRISAVQTTVAKLSGCRQFAQGEVTLDYRSGI